jgi:glycogen(starch) synthase
LRICFVTTEYALHPPFGGIATYTRDAARWLAAHGHEVHVVLVSRNGPRNVERDAGVTIHTAPTQRIKPRRLLAYLARVPGMSSLHEAYAGWNLLENSLGAWGAIHSLSAPRPFDVIEAADWGGLGFWGAVNPARSVPLLLRSHGYANMAVPGWNWDGIRFQLALERFAIRRADFILAASVERVAHYGATFHVAPSRIGSLPYGIDMSRFSPRNLQQSLDGDKVSVLYLGRVERRKGCDVLFDALRMAHLHIPTARTTFVGPVAADMKEDFDTFLRETESWVEYAGAVPQDEVVTYLQRSDVIVLPSRFETLPRVLIEALAAGVPQIATPVNGIPEIVENGVTGILVDPLTSDALAEAIQRLCVSPALRATMAQKSRARALAKFDLDRVMPVQVEVYRTLQERRSPIGVLARCAQ